MSGRLVLPLFALLIASLAIGGVVPASAQSYPSQNVNVIVAFAAGGIADGIGRLIGQKLGERLKQSGVIENRGGAGGNLAARAVSTAAADGHTLLATTTALAAQPSASVIDPQSQKVGVR